MLSRSTYDQEYIDACRVKIDSQIAAFSRVVAAATELPDACEVRLDAAMQAFESVFFNNMVLVLENFFTHRSRTLEKKDGNPLNEVRLLVNSLTSNDGFMVFDKSIKIEPSKSVLRYQVGDEIKLNEKNFVRLSAAFFAEIEKKFLAQ
jgi:hypothetical protein